MASVPTKIATPDTVAASASATGLWYSFPLLILIAAAWLLAHDYHGLVHDSRLYTLQALAYQNHALGQDVFLRYGSQDKYTLFSPVYAGIIRLLGIDAAASVLTAISQVAILVAAWLLARTCMSTRLAALGVLAVAAMPCAYGAANVFACIEPFITPRMAAEALTLLSLAAAVCERPRLAIALALIAMLFHPIMALAGFAAFYCILVVRPRPALGLGLFVLGLIGVLAAVQLGLLRGRFDAEWLKLVADRSPFLFLRHWDSVDFGRVALTLTSLFISARFGQGRATALAIGALGATAMGLMLSAIAVDLDHSVLFTQLQPWRWQWLGAMGATLLLPQTLHTLWKDRTHRTLTTLLLAAWLYAGSELVWPVCGLALASLFEPRLASRQRRLLFAGALGLLAIALLWRIATNLEVTDAHYQSTGTVTMFQAVASFCRDGSAPVGVAALLFWLLFEGKRKGAAATLAVSGIFLAVASQALPGWGVSGHSAVIVKQTEEFRRIIDPNAVVFWPDSPEESWLLLQRPHYLSAIQTAGMVFSRATTMEMQRRAQALAPAVSPAGFLEWDAGSTALHMSIAQQEAACRLGVFDYLVSGAGLDAHQVAGIPPNPQKRHLYLYACSDQARAAAAAT